MIDKSKELQKTSEKFSINPKILISNLRNAKSDTSTEELVLLFNKDFEPEVEILESMMTAIESMNEADVGPELDKIVSQLQKLQESVNDAGIFLPAYDSKKCQHILTNLNNKYQV